MTEFSQLTPYVRAVSDVELFLPWRLKERVIFDYGLLYIKEGSAEVGGALPFSLCAGQLALFVPKQLHSLSPGPEGFHQLSVHFDLFTTEDSKEVPVNYQPLEATEPSHMDYFRENTFSKLGATTPFFITLQEPIKYEELFTRLHKCYIQRDIFWELRTRSVFFELLVQVLKELQWNNENVQKRHIPVAALMKKFIDRNCTGSLTLEDIAANVNYSTYHAAHIFRQCYGVAPITYHRQMRLQKATELLNFSDMSITEIAKHLGYCDIHSFSRAYKDHTGFAPSKRLAKP